MAFHGVAFERHGRNKGEQCENEESHAYQDIQEERREKNNSMVAIKQSFGACSAHSCFSLPLVCGTASSTYLGDDEDPRQLGSFATLSPPSPSVLK